MKIIDENFLTPKNTNRLSEKGQNYMLVKCNFFFNLQIHINCLNYICTRISCQKFILCVQGLTRMWRSGVTVPHNDYALLLFYAFALKDFD